MLNGLQTIEEAPSSRWGRTTTRFMDVFDVSVFFLIKHGVSNIPL
jgi:hypothetical protein